jgi:lipoprotein-releasing system permease protein
MKLPISLYIALRYSKASKQSKFVGLISMFSKAGIALGVMALIIVISVMDGFEAILKDRILGAVPHIVIEPKSLGGNYLSTQTNQKAKKSYKTPKIQTNEQIVQVLPQTQTTAIIQLPNDLQGTLAQGIASDQAIPLGIQNAMVNGQWKDLFETRYGVVIGRYMAYEKGIVIGDKVRLILSGGSHYTPLGRMPAQRNFTVVGLFETESELDNQVVFVQAKALNKLLRQADDHSQGIRLVLSDAFSAKQVISQLHKDYDLSNSEVTSWHDTHGKLFDAVKIEKNMMWFMLSLIIAVAAFNIVSALVMMVTQKQSEIAILKTLGLNQTQIGRVFYFQGAYNGVVGAFVGIIVGTIVTLSLNDVMAITGVNLLGVPGVGLPIDFSFSKVMLIGALSIFLAFIASLYPAKRAAKLAPAEVLRYE